MKLDIMLLLLLFSMLLIETKAQGECNELYKTIKGKVEKKLPTSKENPMVIGFLYCLKEKIPKQTINPCYQRMSNIFNTCKNLHTYQFHHVISRLVPDFIEMLIHVENSYEMYEGKRRYARSTREGKLAIFRILYVSKV